MTPRENSRARAGLAALILLPALEWADTGSAFLRGWSPPGPKHLLPAGMCAAFILFVSLASRFETIRRRLARGFAPLMALTLASLAAILAGELLFSIPALDPIWPYHRRPPGTKAVFEPSPSIMPGVEGASRFTLNSLALRGPELPGDPAAVRILAVGGSTTECVYLDDAETWTALLGERLRERPGAPAVWTGAAGISGYTSLEHLEFLVRAPRLFAQMDAVIFFMGVNDVWTELAGRMEETERSVRNSRVKPWIFRSRLLRRIAAALPFLPDPPRIETEDKTGLVYETRRAERLRAEKTDRLPDLGRAAAAYGERIARLAANCKRLGVRPVFMTQPVLWMENPPPEIERLFWFGWLPDGRYLTAGALRRAMDFFNGSMMETGRKLGVQVIDLSPMNGRPELFYDDCHLNEGGAREAAEIAGRDLEFPPSGS